VVVARSAATVMMVRERHGANVRGENGSAGRGAAVEIFVLRRASTMEFAPQMLAFPGGGVDPRDADPGLPWAGPSPAQWGRLLVADEVTARAIVVAAAREVFEECGVLLAGPDAYRVVGDVSGPAWQAERARLVSRKLSLAGMLISRGLVLRSDLLRAQARWITPEFEPRRYDTRFFAALIPAGQVADDHTREADYADWADPARLLQDYACNPALMLPPTVVCLERVAAAASVAEFLSADVCMSPITPVLTQTDDAVVIRCTRSGGTT